MKIKHLTIIIIIGLTLNIQAQSYTFSVSNGSYSDLAGSTSLNNGMTWDDPQFTIPIGFNFEYFDVTISHLFIEDWGLGGFLTTDTSETGIFPLLIPYGADVIDRGYDFNADSSTTGSLSNISYLIEGAAGSRILKIEWKNVGFYSELGDDNISTDYTNFQLWLYEGTNDIEIHFGPTSVTQPNLSYDGETGSFVALFPEYDYDNDVLPNNGIVLEGNSSSPTMKVISSLDSLTFLNGTIPNGTVYRFSNTNTGIFEFKNSLIDVLIYPNPSNDYFNIEFAKEDLKVESISILNIHGKIVKEINYTGDEIDISYLTNGVYLVQINTTKGKLTKKLIKK